jgi:DNA-binding NarL/FixJ family response regulator
MGKDEEPRDKPAKGSRLTMTRVVVADDHTIIRRGVQSILSEADDLSAAGDAGSSDDLFLLLRSDRVVDLVVMNLSFGKNGVDVLRRIRLEFPHLPVLIYNSQTDEMAMKALRAGASGYIPKETSPEELLVAIRRLAAGGTYLSTETAEQIAAELARGGEGEKPHERLSRRELEVFRLLGAGKSVGEIAKKLKLSVKTVSTHRTRILEKTGLRNNAEIIRYTILNG